ncbi:LysR family transcriptional regulator [Donghicola tyrosinivorans]|uniref:DNA-binding transcriptional LysR family regulator n=1 Tax=Donghicola tyrosinivorans TaxID=1652492 RepID=A0A2T0WHE6_9RHOB|nr:LysR family transcriptional regulator [Donghicola tyrosinivorans]PRY86133.1 DNA-binding transcriptional LysR family regulator [Donghicola tyrosinivorans]
MDKLSGFETFVRAVDLGSFTAAADSLDLSPQQVGKQIRNLEQHLGVQLLHRTTRRQSLTDFGLRFYEQAKVILAEVAEAEAMAAQTSAAPRGKLRVNAPVSWGMRALAPRLPAFMIANPEVEVELSLSNRMVDLVEGGFDAVFRVGQLEDSGLMARKLAPYRLILCAAPAYLASHPPITTPADLVAHNCLGFVHSELRRTWHLDGPTGATDVQVKGRLSSDHGEPLVYAALEGVGLILQPEELVNDALSQGELVQVLPDHQAPTRPMHILYAPDRRITPALRAFIDFAAETFAAP